MNQRFSILYTTLNRPDLIFRQVQYLEQELGHRKDDFEVLFYDDASSSPLGLPETNLNVKLLRGEKNIGLIAARNILVENTDKQSQYFFFLDDDIFVYGFELFISKSISLLDKGYGTVSLPYLNLPLGRSEKVSEFKFIKNLNPLSNDVVFFNGGSSAFSRKAFEIVGPLEGKYFFYLEEEDYSIRLFQNKIPQALLINENCVSIHDQPKGKIASDRRIFLLSNRLVFHYKFIKSDVFRFLLDTLYKLLYLYKMKNLSHFNKALDRAKNLKSEVTIHRYNTKQMLLFFRKRYFNL